MTNLAILNNSIRTLNNLYSLADLHRASGNDPKHRPTYFLRNDQTKALIAEIESENPTCEKSHSSVLIVKNGVGTYACKELVIAYAAWISPAFHLTVLRAFLNQVEQPQQLALPEPDLNLTAIQNSEETLALIIQLYSYCFQAHEMQEKLQNTSIAKLMENQIGGQYLYNFKHPLEQVMAKAKKYVHSNTERLALVKAVNNLLN
ncbi:KilA-N domain-containing protein [Pasteurella multocida]|uniref:KilA-N domain-containing protein n=1 Tax=Pasteurella multocida TaxID=747 RepID=UPI0009F4D0D9|nr:KilA-N domain-containing protein [Pasteurella multocida]MEB3450903.1 KilA-N domain-containing protein [Pasteurella multocida]MEB3452684.1 KilA-N domain-containing protein [Pasteurella multocida]MEB3455080.1 KilA-N domain-containing protein [Pasteurella multocida]MEB3460543.1 KilA-N domain-containing protein [Pasteurella multocida]MEB3462420.1 KilA-N domain-containing protein [Pasteurella multocida]